MLWGRWAVQLYPNAAAATVDVPKGAAGMTAAGFNQLVTGETSRCCDYNQCDYMY